MDVRLCSDAEEMGFRAAQHCANLVTELLSEQSSVTVVLATGNSQLLFYKHLLQQAVDWSRVCCFHLDEYVGLPSDHPASFRRYLKTRVWAKIKPAFKEFHPLDPDNVAHYEQMLSRAQVDLACIGIGENGHIAFNDPPADFNDTRLVKIVELDEDCRKQQVGEGWFHSIDETPRKAATMTIRSIMEAKNISVVVPDSRKAMAVQNALCGPVTEDCPASIIRTHKSATLWLDRNSAALFCKEYRKQKLWTKSTEKETSIAVRSPVVDLQVNGYAGINYSSLYLTEETFKSSCDKLLASGVDVFLPTVISSPWKVYQHCLPIISAALNDPKYFGKIPGIHLEGPFISPKDGARGCHKPLNIVLPDIAMLKQLINLSQKKVKLITIAAEQPGAVELCKYARTCGIIVSLGHQLATSENVANLVQAGATMATHLGNGLPQLLHRHENPFIASLSNDALSAAIITDGHHISADVIRLIIKAKGVDNVIVTSDVTAAGGMPPGVYEGFDGELVEFLANGRMQEQKTGNLAGSGLSIVQCAEELRKMKLGLDEEDIDKLLGKNALKLLSLPNKS